MTDTKPTYTPPRRKLIKNVGHDDNSTYPGSRVSRKVFKLWGKGWTRASISVSNF